MPVLGESPVAGNVRAARTPRVSKTRVLLLHQSPVFWSNTGDSNPYHQFGRLRCCHYTSAAYLVAQTMTFP